MEDFLLFVGIVLFFVAYYRLTHRRKLRLSPRRMIQYLDSIDDLYNTAQKYRQIENIIIELNNINHNHLKGITLEIPKFIGGGEEQYHFICSGGFKTRKFKKIIEQERLKLLEELVSKTRQLDKRKVTTSIAKRWGNFKDE